MDKGLAKFLNRIASDPSNKVLIGRFLALVADLPGTRVQQEHLFALGSTLAEVDPGAALLHLEKLNKSAPGSIETLELLKFCYEKTNKLREAAGAQAQLDRLKPQQPVPTPKVLDDTPKVHLAAKGAQPPVTRETVFLENAEADQTKPRAAPPEAPPPLVLEAATASGSKSSREKTMVNVDVQKAVSEALIKGRTSATEKTKVQNDPQAKVESAKASEGSKSSVFDLGQGAKNQRPMPGEPLSTEAKVGGSSENMGQIFKLKEMFALYWSLGEVGSARGILEKLQPKLGGQDWFEARWEVCQALQNRPPETRSPLVISQDGGQPRLEKNRPHFFVGAGPIWLTAVDEFIEEARYRKALRCIQDQLSADISESDCTAIEERLVLIFKKLSLLPFSWKASMGAQKLQTYFEARPDRKYPLIVGDGI